MLPIDLKSNLTVARSFAPLSRTATANGTALDTQQYNGSLLVVVDCGAASAGTTPTADFTIEDSADNSSFTANTAALSAVFTQVTTTATLQTRSVDLRACRRYVRVVFAIGGTSSPAFPLNAHFVGQTQVQ